MKFLVLLLIAANAFAGNVDNGRRLVKMMGCNDCHTPGFPESGGTMPEKDWLMGSPVGFKGPWGTSYPSNLRLMVKSFKEKPFINYVRSKKYLPPMPGYALTTLTDAEMGDIYAFLQHLGPAGEKAPMNLPPTKNPEGMYIYFVPVTGK